MPKCIICSVSVYCLTVSRQRILIKKKRITKKENEYPAKRVYSNHYNFHQDYAVRCGVDLGAACRY